MDEIQEEQVIGIEPGTHGEELLEWVAWDRPAHERGPRWYWGMSAVGLGLLIYAVASANFLFALIVLMCAIVIYLSTLAEPRLIRVAVTETGVIIGKSFYPFRDIVRFWFVYEPPVVRHLYLQVRRGFGGARVGVDVGDMNPNEVRAALGSFLAEDFLDGEEPTTDLISRVFKI